MYVKPDNRPQEVSELRFDPGITVGAYITLPLIVSNIVIPFFQNSLFPIAVFLRKSNQCE